MRGAVVDLGSCTFHALVADVDELGVRRAVFDRKIVARIGEHAAQRIPDDAFTRGIDHVGDLIARTRPRAPDRFRAIATGVFRDADNGAYFIRAASERHGVAIEILDGHEEARLTWLAASAELAGSHGLLAVIDLGGGSLELAAGETDVEHVHSLPLGALRLRALAPADIRRAITEAAEPALAELRARAADTIVLTSGTARALLALARRLGAAGELQRHLSTRTFSSLARRLGPLTPDAIEVLGVSRSRSDTIAAGAIALATVLEELGGPVVYVARSSLREGALIDLARRQRTISLRRAG